MKCYIHEMMFTIRRLNVGIEAQLKICAVCKVKEVLQGK